MKNEKKKIITSIGIIMLLLFVVGVSYAFFTLTLQGKKDLGMKVGTLSLSYKDQNAIHLEKTYPLSDQEGMNLVPYEFSVENTGDIRALYDIILEENEENTLNSVWLKYSIKRNEEEWSTPKKISSLKLEEGLEVDPGETDVYQLRLWIDEEVGNEAQNKSFKARIVINSVQSNASTSDLTPPVITLNGKLSESVEQGETYTDPGVASVRDDRDTLEISEVKVSYKYFDGESTMNVEKIDTSKIGVYYIYYKLRDTSGNEGRVVRCVNVYQKNTSVPIIKLNGKSMITVEKGKEYRELGATASKDGEDLTSKIVISVEVNTSEAGTYEVKYVVRDEEGNTVSVVRVVHVVSINEDFEANVNLDLSSKPTDKIDLSGENLGDITYSSSDDSIVSVDSDGNVTAVAPGEVVITITTSTGVTKEVHVKVVKTVRASYVKQGSGVTSIGKESDSCTITSKGGSCEVSLPTITVKDGYTSVGWSKNRDATTGEKAGSKITLDQDETYYTISYQNGATYTVNFDANGNTIEDVSRSCVIDPIYNGEAGEMSCRITTPVITAPSATPTVVGYNQDKSAKTSEVGSGESLVLNASNTGKTYYAITKKSSVSYTVNFNANGNTIADTSKSCNIAEVYNGTNQASSCNVTTPVITAPSATPTVVGYNQDKSAKTSEVGSGEKLTVTSSMNGKTYYAITKKSGVTYTVNFNANGNTIADTSKSCNIAEVYNGTSQASSCNVTTPVITAPSATPTVIGYHQDKTAKTSEIGSNASLTVTSSVNGKTYYAITKKSGVTYTVNFNANGNTINGTSKSCNIAEVYNGEVQASSCNITTPVITAPSATPTVVGYHQTQSATSSQVGSNATLAVTSSINGKTYYAITKKDGKTITITFNKNGASTQTNASGSAVSDTSVTRTCNIATVYNGTSQASSCNVTSPVIVASSKTPTVIGYSTATGTHSSSWNQNTSKAVSGNATYYAQTMKASFSYVATFQGSSVISSISRDSASCTIAASYNGASQSSSCDITAPIITPIKGYIAIGWNYTTSSSEVTSIKPGDTISISKSSTFYGIAKPDTVAPVWSLVSTSPSRGTLATGATLSVTFKGTDNSGSVISTLEERDVAIRVGDMYFPIPSLNGPVSVTNGKQYSFSLMNDLRGSGSIAIVIPAGTLMDDAGNENVETVMTTALTMQ